MAVHDPRRRLRDPGGAVYYNGVLYRGVSSDEFSLATNTSYDCCTFRGRLVALDAATGAQRWKSYTLPDQGPGGDIFSGASVLGTTPSIDPASNSIFIGTGQSAQQLPEPGPRPRHR